MAKFGQCCCSVCCLTTGEFDAAFTTIKINGEGTTISHDGCCHYASKTITGAPKQIWCKQYFGYQYTESATIQQRLIKTKKIGGGSYVVDPITGCPLGYDPPDEPANWACDDVRDCGKTERTQGQLIQGFGVVDGYLKELRVAIYQAYVSCNGEAGECKYVVQCSAYFQLRNGLGVRSVFPRTTVRTTQGVCCEQTPFGVEEGVDQFDYHPSCDLPDVGEGDPFDCETSDEIQWGIYRFYWLSRYKIYDAIEDIPSTINFTDADTTNCVFVPCGDGDQEICFEYIPPQQTYREPMRLQKIGYYRNCRFCWSLDFECNDCPGTVMTPQNPYGPNIWRYDGKLASHVGNSEQFQEVYVVFGTGPDIGGTSSNLDDTCHRFIPLPFMSPGPSEAQIAADTNNCHWWDCVDCIYTGQDPIVPPWQIKMADITAYSLTQSYDDGEDIGSDVCITFPNVTVEIISAEPEPE
jgi:hypothetical protein